MKPLTFSIWFQCLLTVCIASDSLSIPSLHPSFLTAYDIDQGLSLSCINNIEVDQKGRLWLNPYNVFTRDKEAGFYRFDGKKSYEVPIQLSDGAISPDSWVIDGITSRGLLYGKDSKNTQALILNPDTHESVVFSFSANETIVGLVAVKDDRLIALTLSPGVYSLYDLSSNKKSLVTTIHKTELSYAPNVKSLLTATSNEKIWFLYLNKGFISVDLASHTTEEYFWKDLLGHEISDDFKYTADSEFIKLTVDRNGNLIFLS